MDYTVPDDFIIDLDSFRIRAKSHWIDSIFKNLDRRAGFNGVVLYSEKGRVVYKKGFGMADFRDKERITTNTPFQLASVSKSITAAAIMILKDNGKLGFNDTITKYIPDFPYKGITIKHLLTHRSGLSRYMSLAHKKWKNKRKPLTNKKMIDLFIKYEPKPYFKPDEGFHYCNTNYAVLAYLVEVITQMPFGKFVKMEIFRPLQMENSFVYSMNDDSIVPSYIDKGATGYRYQGWRLRRVRNDYLNGIVGDKGIYSTVEDLYKFDEALYSQTFISDSTLHEAFTPGSPDYWRRRDNYGYGWRIKTSMDSCVYHYGWWKGFRSFFIRDMKKEKTIIVLSNISKGPGSYNFWKVLNNNEHELGYICRNYSH